MKKIIRTHYEVYHRYESCKFGDWFDSVEKAEKAIQEDIRDNRDGGVVFLRENYHILKVIDTNIYGAYDRFLRNERKISEVKF